MKKTIAFDLGTNSIGWAIRNTNSVENQITDHGVLTFEKGVGEEKGVEVPLVKKRTESRGKRRNYQATKYRKWQLLKCLIENSPKMCPLTLDELYGWQKYKKGIGTVYPSNKNFTNWLRLDFDNDGEIEFENPYELRKIAAEKKLNDPMALGRVFYNLVQRRGFKGRDEEEAKTIMEGSEKLGTRGANEIQEIIKNNQTTLGGALYIDLKNNGSRIRKRYNVRTNFETELKAICTTQGIFEGSKLYKELYKSIIWQRPLRTQKGNVGICTYERFEYSNKTNGKKLTSGKPRCPISHPVYEEYRALSFINNIKIKELDNINAAFHPLTKEQKENIYKKLFLRKSKPHFPFSEIIKLLDPKNNLFIFNYETGATNKSPNIDKIISNRKKSKSSFTNVAGSPITAALKDIFRKEITGIKIPHSPNEKRKGKKDYYDYEDIWHVLFTFDSKEKLKDFALNKLQLTQEQAETFSKIKFQQGYASLSLCALNKILPYLQEGFIYSEAVYLANITKVFGRKPTNEEIEKIIDGIRNQIKLHKRDREIIGFSNGLINNHLNLPREKNFGRYSEYLLSQKDIDKIKNSLEEYYGNKTWEELDEEIKTCYKNKVSEYYQAYLQTPPNTDKRLLFIKIPRLDERIKNYLKEEWNAKDENLKYLYHPSEIDIYVPAKEKDGKRFLDDPMPISRGFKNPMALKTLHHLKRLVNYLLKHNKIDEETRVVVEIARELNDANRRKAIERWQNDRKKQNQEYYAAIKEISDKYKINIDPNNDEIIDKYRLWIEQNRQCIYTGKIINCSELFDGTKFDFEHTIPADLSFDNELKNLTIADSKYNREIKQKSIPTELPNYENEITIRGEIYSAIKPRLKFIEEKVEHFEQQVEFWKKQSKIATTKDRKDYSIQQKHYNQFELDYWRKKLETFTTKEYKAGWRNSQLRDTQIITKYALPYLKTVFNKVEVQKGIITAEFRKIYNVGFEKDRNKHTHHAVDAAILSLIPHAAIRDKLLKEHFAALENNIVFHTTPYEWPSFKPEHIRKIDEETLINYILQDRTLISAKKYVRKRGKLQYVKEKLEDGSWQYKLDEEGKKIPLISQGDSIRGQLHKESFYGAIQDPHNKKEEITYVVKVLIRDFEKEKDIEDIVDPAVRKAINTAIKERINNGKSFKEAIAEDIWMTDNSGIPKRIDKKGNTIFPIRHVRCRVKAGRGYLSKALQIKEHAILSKHDYKQWYYAQNEINYLYLLYENRSNEKIKRTYRIINLLDLKNYKIKSSNEFFTHPYFSVYEKGKQKVLFELKFVLKVGTKVIMWNESPEELSDLSKKDLLKRIYKIYKFNEIGTTGYLYLQNHLEARNDKELSEGDKYFDPLIYQPRLRFSADNLNCLIEGKDFKITLDGEINIK